MFIMNIKLPFNFIFSDCQEKDVAENAKDDAMAKWLWEVSDKWTSIHK